MTAIVRFYPSNATQGDAFIAGWCGKCSRAERDEDGLYCNILFRTMGLCADDSDYPAAWRYGTDGEPCCTAFIPEGEPIPEPACKHTHDLFPGAL